MASLQMEATKEELISKIMTEYAQVLQSTLNLNKEDGEMLQFLEPGDIDNVASQLKQDPRERLQFRLLMAKLQTKCVSESVEGPSQAKRSKLEISPSAETRFQELLQTICSNQQEFRESITKSHEATEKSLQEISKLLREIHIDSMSVAFSKASAEKVSTMNHYFNLTGVSINTRKDFLPDEVLRAFPLFAMPEMKWGSGEVSSTPTALDYIKDALIYCGASLLGLVVHKDHSQFDMDYHFKLVNVCDQNHLSLLTDSTKFTGGIDGVILPMRVDKSWFQYQIRVGIELKHPDQVATESQWQQAINQARVQVVVANVLSHHPVMHLLTDLKSKFLLFKIVDMCVYEFMCPDAPTAIKCLTHWLNCSSIDPAFIYIENSTQVKEELKPSLRGSIKLQRKSRSGDLRDELKLDILDDLEPEERASYMYQTLMSRFGNFHIDPNNNQKLFSMYS